MKTYPITILLLLLASLLVSGCAKKSDVSKSEEEKMRNAAAGKGYGQMPPEQKAAMEKAMRDHAIKTSR